MAATPSHDCAVNVENVAVRRGERRIIDGATFSIAPGEAIIVTGVNGAGKTTLLRAIAGFLPIESGAISVFQNGERLDDAAARRAAITYCGHANALKPNLTALETLKFWAALYGATEAAIASAIEDFDLAELKHRSAGMLSAGQRRRLGVSRLAVSSKPVWLLDEPTASIDIRSAQRLSAIIAKHCRRGGGAIIATHDRFELDGARRVSVENAAEAA